MRNFIYTAIILASIIFVTLSMAESSTMTFSTHVREDTVVFKTTFVLLEEAFKRVGFKFVLKTYPGKRALILSNNGETDGEAHRIYGLTNNGKYPNLVRIPEIQQIIYNYAYAIQNINLENGWEDLTPYTIAVQRGSVFLTEMANKYAKETHEISTTVQMFDFLKAGRADIVLFTPVGAHPIMDMEKFKNSKN
jgi:polar amino acid transport system substrate-binding protein